MEHDVTDSNSETLAFSAETMATDSLTRIKQREREMFPQAIENQGSKICVFL